MGKESARVKITCGFQNNYKIARGIVGMESAGEKFIFGFQKIGKCRIRKEKK